LVLKTGVEVLGNGDAYKEFQPKGATETNQP